VWRRLLLGIVSVSSVIVAFAGTISAESSGTGRIMHVVAEGGQVRTSENVAVSNHSMEVPDNVTGNKLLKQRSCQGFRCASFWVHGGNSEGCGANATWAENTKTLDGSVLIGKCQRRRATHGINLPNDTQIQRWRFAAVPKIDSHIRHYSFFEPWGIGQYAVCGNPSSLVHSRIFNRRGERIFRGLSGTLGGIGDDPRSVSLFTSGNSQIARISTAASDLVERHPSVIGVEAEHNESEYLKQVSWVSPKLLNPIAIKNIFNVAVKTAYFVCGVLCITLGVFCVKVVVPETRTIISAICFGCVGIFMILFCAQWFIGKAMEVGPFVTDSTSALVHSDSRPVASVLSIPLPSRLG
jgi:hypothetical protein